MKEIIISYRNAIEEKFSPEFNIFTIISDVYHRENFHSDVLKAFLDSNSGHNEGSLFLDQFIKMINSKMKAPASGKIAKYENATVERERHRIDILIKNGSSKNCIIIENKINGAVDMPKQLSRYYQEMNANGYHVDAIVYLTKTENEVPDRQSYEEIRKRNIDNLICVIPASSSSPEDITLIKDWISPCVHMAKNIDCKSILCQYGRLIESLLPNHKIKETMNDLYDYLTKNDISILGDIKAIAGMLHELPCIMASRLAIDLKDKYAKTYGQIIKQPMGVIWAGDQDHCVIQLKDNYCVYIICHADKENAYELNIVNWNEDITKSSKSHTFSEQGFHKDNSRGRYYKYFGWNDKEGLIDTVGKILKEIFPLSSV